MSRTPLRTPLVAAAAAAALSAAVSIALVPPHPAQAAPLTHGTASAAAGTHTPASVVADYYADAEGKTGDALATALHGIIKEQSTVTYDQVWDALQNTDRDPNNSSNVIELYTGRSIAASDHGGDQGQWNREHVWAKSHGDFGTATGPGTDLHHLRPSDVHTNSVRSNKDFDNGGSAVDGAAGNYTDGDSFEPRDAVKGDVARMILYMDVRYDGDDSFPDLEVNDSVDNGSAPHIGRISVLKQWSEQDPPDAFEKTRNDVIYNDYQHNRNPFIDHPEWVESIW